MKADKPYFSPKQRRVYRRAVAKINILSGAMTSGKTYITDIIWADRQLGKHGAPPVKDSVILGRTKGTIRQNVINPLLEYVGALGSIRNEDGLSYLHIGNRRSWYAGADNEREYTKVLGKEYGDSLVDEATELPENILRQVLGRTRGRAYLTMNPGSPFHWLYQEYIRQPVENVYSETFGLLDNPTLNDEQRADIMSRLKGLFLKRYGLGLWVAAEGAIYDMFDPAELFPLADVPATRDRHIASVDYGTANPCVFGYYRRSEGVAYKIDEWRWDSQERGRQKTDSEYGRDFTGFIGGRPLDYVVSDPSAASFITELRSRGYMVRLGTNVVLEGIRHTAELLGSRRLRICDTCPDTALSMSAYSWDPAAQRRGEDKPLKVNDHEADETRYAAMDLIPQAGGVTDSAGVATAGVVESIGIAG